MEKNWKFLALFSIIILAFSTFAYLGLPAESHAMPGGGNDSENLLSGENVQPINPDKDMTPPENEASLHFTSVPDLYNWNIYYPQPGWEDSMDWFLGRMDNEGDFMLNAGDIMDARWWEDENQVRSETQKWWGAFDKRFEDKDIELYIAPGDHEFGDDKGLLKMDLAPVYAEQFDSVFDLPENGPEFLGVKGLSYSFTRENLAVITVNTFENSGDHISMSVSDKQVEWLDNRLEEYQDKEFIIVQGHGPVVGPVESKSSSGYMLEEGVESDFWKTMVEHDVDVYLCGEHHRITASKRDGIWQIVHGALWGSHTNVNYLRGSVYQDELKLELFRFPVEYSGDTLENHPNRWFGNGPKENVTIPENVKENGMNSAGELVIQTSENGNQTVKATGEFVKSEVTQDPSDRSTLYALIGAVFVILVVLKWRFW